MIQPKTLDQEIAVKVFGHELWENKYGDVYAIINENGKRMKRIIPGYSTNMNYAMRVVEKMREKGFDFMIKKLLSDDYYFVYFNRASNPFEVKESIGLSLSLAICLAAVKE